MLLSKRLFPYPVLKKTPHQDYEESFYQLDFEQDKIDAKHKIRFENIQFTTNNEQFRTLVNSGKINVFVHFECSNTLYRKILQLKTDPINFEINKKQLNGKLHITSFAVAAEDIHDYYDMDFVSDYNGTHFDIDKYDIIAYDDGYSIDIIHDIDKDDKISSIFVVVPKIDNPDDGAEFTYQNYKIIIKLPQHTYRQYDRLKYSTRYQNLFFSIFAIPILAMSLNNIKDVSYDDLEVQFQWFISVKKVYKKLYNQELDQETFEKTDTFIFSQRIFDNAISKTIDDLYNEGNINTEDIEDEED